MNVSEPKTGYPEAGVADMAARREARAREQLELLAARPDCCVVSFTLNVAGPVKRTPLTDRAFFAGADKLVNACAGAGTPNHRSVRLEKLVLESTGDEALLTVRGDAEDVKRVLVALEEGSPMGRLYDMDVIAPGGHKIGRSTPRKCLICDETASVCARSRKHTVAELQHRTAQIIKEKIADNAAELAAGALVTEVRVTPKAGLVDRNNRGANPDMDLPMFERSAEALRPFFREIALAVLNGGEDRPLESTAELSDPALAGKLREIGLRAEEAMLDSTGGVNTHRGAIWSIGILTAAYAYCAAHSSPFETDGGELTESLITAVKTLAENLGDGTAASSKGAKARREYGVGGPVEEAKAGFPSARLALEQKKEYETAKRRNGVMLNPWAYGLLAIMAELDDNNALRRGGEEGAEFVKARAKELLEAGKTLGFRSFLNEMFAFDRELTERNVSCGGAADMLACAIFIENAGERYFMRSERFIRAFAKECSEQ